MEKVQESVVAKDSGAAKEEMKPTISEARKALVLAHRTCIKEALDKKMDPERKRGKKGRKGKSTSTKVDVRLTKEKLLRFICEMKETYLKDMQPSSEQVYENTFIVLTIIEDPDLTVDNVLTLIVEDKNKDVIRFQIFNYDKDKEALKKYVFGCLLGLINPFVVKLAETKEVSPYIIRNYDWRCTVQLEKPEKVCRLCLQENATKNCPTCKRFYCSRECQLLDWKQLKHKLICTV